MTNTEKPVLYYVHDPMCSWCWAFRPVWMQIQEHLKAKVIVRYLLGGLAADTMTPMPDTMRNRIQYTWREIQAAVPGTEFNFDFWQQCQPKRSTYPSCRAIIACRRQSPEKEPDMLLAIQKAYYREARNPSEIEVLTQIAKEIGLDAQRFKTDIKSEDVGRELKTEIAKSREIGAYSFPSLVLALGNFYRAIDFDYTGCDTTLTHLDTLLG